MPRILSGLSLEARCTSNTRCNCFWSLLVAEGKTQVSSFKNVQIVSLVIPKSEHHASKPWISVHHSVLQHRVNPIVGHALNVEVLPDIKEPSQREFGDEILTCKMWVVASGASHVGERGGGNRREDRTTWHRAVDGP